MKDQHGNKKLPTEHERAPKVSAEITPTLKGGHMERKIKDGRD
ncbi:hypothetical protein [Bartonella sp. TP]|nr:hypothetical protein [Bartonella sp. TP]WJW79688.1 hypothetical protein QVL57_04015 [Bartonella sp. TP]